jgi:signal transduction histidine kinase
MEAELRLAQKLEAVGQLAAGVAHEINNPIQYVGDSLQFISEGVRAIVDMAEAMRTVAVAARGPATTALVDQLLAITETADLAYVAQEMTPALESVQQGVRRVAKIVRAMKELSHPGARDAIVTDINRALANALELTANQYKYVADLQTDFGELPPVACYPSDLNQVFLNLIVNAVHAMEDRPGRRGTLGIKTRLDGNDVVVSISDTGTGIPEAIQTRIYDAFFTTKDVGRGTGQGLAIARSIVVERHGGSLGFDTDPKIGTTFHVRIPAAGPQKRPLAA